jgi:hypothetical protein
MLPRRRWFAMRDVSVATPSSVAVRRELRRTPDLEEMDWRGTDGMCAIGAWSARAMLGLVAAYVAVFVVGFASVGNLSKPGRARMDAGCGGIHDHGSLR